MRIAASSAALVLVGVSVATAARPGKTLGREVSTLESRTHRALLDLYALDSRLHAAEQRLASLNAEARRLRAEGALIEQQIGATRHSLETSQQLLGQNLRMLYKQGNVSALAVVLGSESLDDALSRLDALNSVADETQRVVEVTTDAQSRLARLESSLQAQQSRVDAEAADARAGAAALASARAERIGFISTLRRQQRLKSAQLAALQSAAQRVERKSDALQAAAAPQASAPPEAVTVTETPQPPPPAPAPAAARGTRTITVSATGYSLAGRTATGIPVGYGVVAVDPSLIPLGTRLTVPGYGEGVAADTGGAVRGATIDLWFPTLAQARAWGRRTVTITLH